MVVSMSEQCSQVSEVPLLSKLIDILIGTASRAAEFTLDGDMRLVMPLEGTCAMRASLPAATAPASETTVGGGDPDSC
jgi:hypothetical protein